MPKTMSASFHLNNRQAKHQLNVTVDNRLQFQNVSTYLGVKLDRSPTFKEHLVGVNQKISAQIALIRCLAGTTWGAARKTLRLSTQALVFSATEYCAPAWGRSRHTSRIDTTIHEALQNISGCLHAIPENQLPILAGIAPLHL